MPEISQPELLRIERFIAAYNAIDDYLQAQLPHPQSFRGAVDWCASRHPWWRDAENLRLFATLRNFLVHEKTRPFDYPATPSQGAVEEIEAIRARLTSPATLGEKFSREVLVLAPSDSLETALKIIAKRAISRFPIYDGSKFIGLLTENGIARFLAQTVEKNEVFTPKIAIERVLPRETKRRSFLFAPPETHVVEAAFWFHDDTFLETILIGQSHQKPLGIVTRGDVAGWVE